MKLKFVSPSVSAGSTGRFVIDVASAMSVMKRRLYPQHRNWTITGGYIVDNNNHSQVTFSTAPDNWATRTAMQRCADKWYKQQNDVFSGDMKSSKPKWHDFKVHLLKSQVSVDGVPPTTPTLLNPDDSLGNDYPNGEWTYSSIYSESDSIDIGNNQVVTEDSDESMFHIVGDHFEQGGDMRSYGAIQGWQNSRPQVSKEPIVDSTQESLIQNDYLNNIFDDGHILNEALEDSQDDGDEPPYDMDNVPNETMDVAYAATQPGASSIAYFPGFTALAGQIEVQYNNKSDTAGSMTIMLEVIPGGAWIDPSKC